MKRILSILLLTIIMGLSFMTPVLAKDQYIYIDEHEEFDVTSSEIEEFERIAEEYEDKYNLRIPKKTILLQENNSKTR